MKESTVLLSVDVLHQHPQNPRKDLGELGELTESIKKNGIMQNLTVIPGHWDEKGNFNNYGYTLLIGHRRFAAAKAAGLKEVPCRIVEDMDEKEQLSTMLEENMQRTDLTIWEQATGFQLMLDLGETEEGIAEKTGFSKQTIRHRLNIAKLDGAEIKKKEQDDAFQLTLRDLYELEKIKSIKTRNEILKKARDSRDLVWRAHIAVNDEKENKRADIIIKLLMSLGVKQATDKEKNETYAGKWETVKEWDLKGEKEPELARKTQADIKSDWRWFRSYGLIKLIKPASWKKEIKQDPMERNKKELKKKVKELLIKKHVFIDEVITGKLEGIKEEQETYETIWKVLVNMGTYVSKSVLREFFTGKDDYKASKEEKDIADDQIAKTGLMHQLLIQLDDAMDHVGDPLDWRCVYQAERGAKFKQAFQILTKWGWSFEEEEKSIIDGTHELYEKEK